MQCRKKAQKKLFSRKSFNRLFVIKKSLFLYRKNVTIMGFFNFFNHHHWSGGNDDNDDLNYNDNEGTKFVVGGDEGGKFLNHCGGNMWMDSDGDLNVRTGDHSWMDMNDGGIFFG